VHIAAQNEQSFEYLQNFYRERNSDNRVTSEYEPDELRDLVLAMAGSFDSATVIADGSDECGTNTSDVVDLLASLNTHEKKSNVMTLFLSRDEIDSRERLHEYERLSIAGIIFANCRPTPTVEKLWILYLQL